ncbi:MULTISPECIES: hypothetical protein [unclassified Pseudofrankia]|uniref:hypothetical protein n=1 Tax=unclassified Pseudofrankia TaxID=2994372 RepID=UPI0008D96229|nr:MULTISPECIES: hypothetical protein [unclassified Pseudofrankia]MDT3442018.1 hypothetical protein [Pseudofrankia sp. BMG5.37]OHV69116.1 hypothetical protein BCD48_35050 [Pseudofrankia sp. BMG5.36]
MLNRRHGAASRPFDASERLRRHPRPLILTVLYLGIVLGPLAVCLSLRSRRSVRRNRAANWGLILGLVGFVLFWVRVGGG